MRVNEDRMMQNATVVFLDEVFKGSSAILHFLLSFLNERVFIDRGEVKPVKMRCLFAATNELPDSAELRAVLDRFVLRCPVENAREDHASLGRFMERAWPLTYHEPAGARVYPKLLDDLAAFRESVRRPRAQLFSKDDGFVRQMAQRIGHARQYGLSDMSNRRVVKLLYIMLLHRMYEAVRPGGAPFSRGEPCLRDAELNLIPRYFLDRWDPGMIDALKSVSGVVTPK